MEFFSGTEDGADTPMTAPSRSQGGPSQKRRTHAFAAPPPPPPAAVGPDTPCRIIINVDGLSAPLRELLTRLHASLAAYPSLDGGIAPSAAALSSYGAVLDWLRANVFMHGDAYELDLEHVLNIVQATWPRHFRGEVTPFILAAACVELKIADSPSRTWCAANMSRLKNWRVRGSMWDLRTPRTMRGGMWHVDTERRVFYEALLEHARQASMPVYTHGHVTVLCIARDYFELRRAQALPGTMEVRKAALDVAVHMFLLARNAALLLQAHGADALDGLSTPVLALAPTHVRVSKEFSAMLERAEPTTRVPDAHVDELRALCRPYAWMFACAHGVAHDTFELEYVPDRPHAWANVFIKWDV